MMNELKFKRAADANQACEVLENVLEGLKGGTVCIQLGEGSLTLKPTERIYLKIQATQKGEKKKASDQDELAKDDRRSTEIQYVGGFKS